VTIHSLVSSMARLVSRDQALVAQSMQSELQLFGAGIATATEVGLLQCWTISVEEAYSVTGVQLTV
jgi:high-affinity nickel permease